MPFDIQEYYNKHKDYYGDVPLDAVAKDIYDRGYSDKFGDFGEFKKAAGIHDTILADSNRRKGPSSVSPLRLGESFVKGAAEGLTTELPSMVGKSLQFVGPPGGKIEHAGKSIADWAEEKREAWYGPEEERSGLDRIVYEGAKMFAPSVIPGGIAGTAARGALRVGSIAAKAKTAADVAQKTALMTEATRKAGIAVNIGSGAAAGLFGLSQAQETRDTALERADQLEAEGKTKEAQEMRKKAYGVAPLATGAVEALGEFLGTKYLAKLFRLDESVIAKMGTKEFAINLLKTMGVEVGTEISQEGSQAFIEKHTGIRPEANPLQEAMDVIGPTVFLTLLTGGLAGAANKMRSDDKSEREGAQELERLKQGAVLTMTIHDGLKTGQHQGRPFTADDASKLMKMGQAAGFYTKDDIERFHEQYPVLKPAANELLVEDVKKKVTEALFNEKGQPLLPPGQGFTFRDVDYGIPVGEPYGGEDILRPTITRAPEEAIDAEFETIRQLPAVRRDETLALPPGQGFTLIETPPAKEVDYQAEAEKHGVKYNGIQKGHKDIPDMPMFTANIDGVQTTFVLNQGETLPQAIERKRLQKAEYDARETKKEPIDVESGASPVTEVPVGQIKLSKDVKQFKEGADEAGIVAGQEIKGEGYRRTPYNPIVLWRRNNGDLEVVTGRHRLEFAKRIGEETIPAQILNESDGFTAQDALTFDAEQNILDNQGTERDYANYFRNTEIDEATARERGLLRGKKAASAFLLGKDATDQTFNAFFRHKDIGFRQAVAIARAAPGDERLQLAGRSYVAKNPRATEMEVENFVRAISLAKEAPKQVQGDLFGFDDSAIRTAEMQAKKASAVMGRLRRDLSNINAAIRGEGKLVLSDEGVTEYGIKDPNSKEQLQTAKTKIQNEIGKWEKWYVNPELVKQLTETSEASPVKPAQAGKPAEVKAAEQAKPKAETKPKAAKERTAIGQNEQGNKIYEDENGVRSIVESGVRISETVQVVPTEDGLKAGVDVSKRARRFKTTDELAGEKPVEQTKSDLSEKSTQELVGDIFSIINDHIGNRGSISNRKIVVEESLYQKIKPYLIEIARRAKERALDVKAYLFGAVDAMPNSTAKKVYESAAERYIEEETSEKDESPAAPYNQVADSVLGKLQTGIKFTRNDLFAMCDKAFNGTLAEGKYSAKDAYDALEMGVNKYIMESPSLISASPQNAKRIVADLKGVMELLPTQSTRTEEMDEWQQFSTPPPLAYAANWVSNLNKNDSYLEPSGGTGGLASFALIASNRPKAVVVNELAPRRAAILNELGFDRVFTENAEQLNNILPQDVKPTVVVMNPPFSATAGRVKGQRKTANATVHIEQALKRLQPGGRLVAIVGKGMAADRPAFEAWWNKIRENFDVLANVGISGQEYAKYGTTFDNQIVIIDKPLDPSTKESIIEVREDVNKVEELIDLLTGVRNARTDTSKQKSTEQGKQKGAAIPETEPGRSDTLQPPIGGVVAGAQPGRLGRKADADSGGDEGLGAGERDEVSGAKPRDEGTGRPGAVATGQKQPTRVGRPDRADDTRQTGDDTSTIPPEAVESLTVEQREAVEKRSNELTDSVYDAYRPVKVKIPNAKEHPGKLVESAAMASVEPIDPAYSPRIPERAVKSGKISIAQLEAVVYAGQAHSELLPNGSRKGFFIGDGTGVGKGREIAAIIWDNWNQGRRKALWISQNSPLMKDAKRDISGVGWDPALLFDIGKAKLQDSLSQKEGIGFLGYGVLRSGKTIGGKEVSRLNQLMKWLGKDFDGCIIFDESHNMGNALPVRGKRGTTKPSTTALTGVELQRLLPKARVVYVSATGATEVMNLAYAERLGLWGDKTPFPTATHFVSSISSGGITAMELVAMNMKANGVYTARSLAYDDVKYERLEHPLTGDQRQIYDELAGAWQIAQRAIDAAMATTGITGVGASGGQVTLNPTAKSHVVAQFWGTNQRFWNQVITAMQMPSVVQAIEEDLKAGRAPLVQLIDTNEAAQERSISRLEEEDSLEDLDITPREMLIEYVNNSFPIYQFETYTDDQGNERSRLVRDSNGDPVINPEAVEMRDELLMKIAAVRVPDGPLEILLDHFGVDQVAEITGRTRRVVYKDTAEGRKRVVEPWSKTKGTADADAFMADKKKILVFSRAGGTGRSYHADRTEKNTRLRRHYLVQAGWRADVAVQGLGRSHRTNQEQAPEWVLVTTNLEGQRRFISSIARRLSQLGALTKGSRETGNQGLFNARDNLESIEAVGAFHQLLEDLHEGSVSDITMSKFIESTGLDKIIDQDTGALNVSQLPAITQFLNRILNMKIEMQNKVFGEFLKRLNVKVATAIEKGTLDVGVETIRAKSTEKVNEQDVYQDEKTKAKATYVEVELTHDAKLLTFNQSQAHNQFGYAQNIKSGRIWALAHRRDKTDAVTGGISSQYTAIGANHNYHTITEADVNNPEKYNKLSNREAEPLWNADYEAAPKEIKERVHMITGAVLPIWDRLPTGTAKIYRLQVDGKNIIGRVIGKKNLDETLRKLGAQRKAGQYKTDDVFDNVLSRGYKYGLSNGWNIQRRKVADDFRIEIKGPNYYNLEELRKYGVFTERIGYETRFFIPTEKGAGVRAINEIISSRPIVDEVAAGKKAGDVTAQDAAFMNETEQYAIGTRTEAGDISLVDVQATFRGQKVTQTKEGFLISTSAGNVLVKSVDRIDANTYALNVGYGKKRLTEGDVVAGRYRGGVIALKRGTADRFTLAHESIHFMEDIGVIGAGETKLLKNHIKNLVEAGKLETLNPEDIGGAEDRAEFLAGKLTQEPKGLLGRIIRNIQDFIDRIVNAFGVRTVKGIVRDIKTGKVFGSRVDTRAELAYNYVHEEVSDREREALRGDTRGQAGVQYQPTVVGREKIGVAKAASRTIRKPRDAAQIASQYLKRYPDEHLISMVMDKSGKLLHIYRHTVGLPGYTQVSVAIVAGEALNTPGAANIIVAHNHPSQRAELSAEDRAFTKSLEDTLRGSGVKLTDSLAVTSDSYSSHKETGGDLQTGLSGAAAGKVNIPILGRVFEVIHNGPKISNPESAKAQAETFIPGGGILVMDGQSAIAGTVDISDFNKIRGNVQAELLKAFEQRNGRNMIVYAPNRAIKPKEADNLSRFLRAARNEVKLLDIIDTTGSWADQGNLPLANVGDVDFYSYRAKADTFYSKLIKTVTDKIKEMPSKIQSIPKWLGRQNVKPAEMKWMGVEQWLKDNSKNGVIGKQAFADFLKSNQIEIREVTKGGNVGNILKRSQIRPHIENGETVFGYNDTTEEWDSVSNVKEANQYAEFSLTRPESGTKFHAYTIPGGENYRELLLMLPPPKRTIPSYEEWVGLEKMKQEDASVWDFAGDVKAEIDFSRARYEREKVPLHSEEAYRSTHWDEPNVLAHVRMNDRVDADGNKILFLEEVQSDWHQEGKKKGYGVRGKYAVYKNGNAVGEYSSRKEAEAALESAGGSGEGEIMDLSRKGVPAAPFAENWHELLMKRMLRYAAENGYDKIAWTTGEQQADRYDLSKQLDSVEVRKVKDSDRVTVYASKDNKNVITKQTSMENLPDIIGKDLARKAQFGLQEGNSAIYSGLDLKVGGEGMKSFYDNLIPGFMNKYVKQWGAKVGLIDITAEGVNEYGESIDESVTPSREVSAHSVDITPAMKQDVLFKGQEYYSIRDSKAPPTTRDPKVVNEYIKDEADAIFQTIMNKLKPKSMTWLETMLKSPEWFDHPQINNIVRLFVRDRNEIYHQTFNDLNMADDIDATESTITEAGKALKGKGLSLVDRLAGKESAEYKMLSDFLDYFDTEAKRDPNKSDAENLADCEAYMRKNGATDDVVRVWRLYRQSYDKALDLQTRQLREMIDKVVEEAMFRGESPEASLAELKSTLKYALAEMEKWRGYYAPRIREAGDWKVQAYKEHGPLEANREYYREHRASELSAQRLAKKLAREGWKITSIGRVEKLPESVYQDVKAVAAAKLIDKALERVEAHDTSLVGLNAEILRAVADEIKARGFRSHMIHRKGGAVIKGYIEDPLTRHLLYINQLSGGISKSVVAQRVMKELLGEKIMGKQVGGIDPVADPRAYAVATNYIQEQLRNMDATDRVIGLAKSVATFKFLGFNLRSLTVNMTALLTTTPTSIHQYATGGKGNMTTILKSLVSAGKDFGSFMAGRKLASAEEQAFLEEIHKKGWDDAQYTRDALGTIQRTHSRAWSEAMSASMYLFGVSEKFNRGTTLLSAYRMARKQGHSAEEAAEMAKTASDNAHGAYGRATLPMWAQGPNPAAKIGQMLYVYAKFPHNYLQMLYDVGFKKHNVKGALFAFLSPIVLAGVAALPFKDVIFAFAGFLLRAIGDDERDPEKWVWDNVRKHLGEGAERAGRHGITGALGVDLSGSLSIGVGVPKGLMDLTGAIGGVIEDVGAFGQGIATKQYSKAAESILPTGLGNPLRAYRESKEGVSTRDNRPVWDESGRQFVPTGGEAATKALGFRSTRQAVLSERTWEARRQRASFNEKRSQIYRKYRAWILSGRDKERYREIVKEVQKYNRDLHRLGLEREIAPITSQSLKSQSGRMQAPSKRDRAMLENRY